MCRRRVVRIFQLRTCKPIDRKFVKIIFTGRSFDEYKREIRSNKYFVRSSWGFFVHFGKQPKFGSNLTGFRDNYMFRDERLRRGNGKYLRENDVGDVPIWIAEFFSASSVVFEVFFFENSHNTFSDTFEAVGSFVIFLISTEP